MKTNGNDKKFKYIPFIIASVLLIAIAAVDFLYSKYGYNVKIFYVIPVAIISWYYGLRPSLAVAVLSALINLAATEAESIYIQVWETVSMGFVLLCAIVAIDIQRESQATQNKLINFIVHDLRSPVTNILSGLQTIKITAEDKEGDDPVLDEIIDMAEISSNRLLTLINSILDINRFEQHSMSLTPSNVEIKELIEEAKIEVMQWANQENMAIDTIIETPFSNITIDKDLTVRTIINILGNAIKYNLPGEPIIIRVYQRNEATVRFSIADHGMGIPKEWQKKVFDKFAQVQAKESGVPSTGLGLTFCREAVTAQGGKIWVDDSFTEGTNIVFFLPVDITKYKKMSK